MLLSQKGDIETRYMTKSIQHKRILLFVVTTRKQLVSS